MNFRSQIYLKKKFTKCVLDLFTAEEYDDIYIVALDFPRPFLLNIFFEGVDLLSLFDRSVQRTTDLEWNPGRCSKDSAFHI